MPGFTTHYLFGQQTYQKLPLSDLKKTIQKYHTVFALGLQGPDIFFYNPFFLFRRAGVPGSLVHTANTQEFLRQLLKSPEIFHAENEKKIARTYVFGFIGHYLLDCACHPYIYARSYHPSGKKHLSRHLALETDIDTVLLWKFQHRYPSEFHQTECIAQSKEQLEVISTLLYFSLKSTFSLFRLNEFMMKVSIRSMQTGCRLLYDASGYKKILIRRMESIYPGYAFLSSLIASDTIMCFEDPLNLKHHSWTNPWDESLRFRDSFMDLFDSAKKEYYRILKDIEVFFYREYSPPEKEAAFQILLNRLGNRSYHSGLNSERI